MVIKLCQFVIVTTVDMINKCHYYTMCVSCCRINIQFVYCTTYTRHICTPSHEPYVAIQTYPVYMLWLYLTHSSFHNIGLHLILFKLDNNCSISGRCSRIDIEFYTATRKWAEFVINWMFGSFVFLCQLRRWTELLN